MKTNQKTGAAAAVQKKRRAVAVGATVLAFALVGVVTVAVLLTQWAISWFDDSEKKASFEKFIAPVVMVDPVAFSNVANADEHALLMSSMWNLLTGIGENETTYPEDEYGMMLIPASDLDVSAASLFGSEVSLSHQTFGNTSLTFEYNAENSCYTVPPMGYNVQYQPRVDKIRRKGKMYTLTVAYMASSTTLAPSENTAKPDKIMYYTLEKIAKNKYVIRAIQETPQIVEYEYYSVESTLPKTESESSEKSSSQAA